MQKTYKYDPHNHTAETSKCGRIPAAKLVDTYHDMGYSGLVVTDHLHETYISLLYCCDDWDTCVDRFLDGYKRAKKRGDEIGFHVILGAELRFPENDNDYLIYGIDEEFLRANPYLYRMGAHKFFEKFGDQLLIIHAHPYRDENEVVFHECVHGVELVNGNMEHRNYNRKTYELCKAHPEFYRICGSDTHRPKEENMAWVEFDAPVRNSFEFKAAVESGKIKLGCNTTEDDAKLLLEAEEYFAKK